MVSVRGGPPVSALQYAAMIEAEPDVPQLANELWDIVLSHIKEREDRFAFSVTCKDFCALWRSTVTSININSHTADICGPPAPPGTWWRMLPNITQFVISSSVRLT